jgi:hypothetical protein
MLQVKIRALKKISKGLFGLTFLGIRSYLKAKSEKNSFSEK